MSNILDRIVAHKREEVAGRKSRAGKQRLIERLNQSGDQPRGFFRALGAKNNSDEAAVIAEVKKASPSQGVIREAFYPAEIARAYQDAGATCLSVLTDQHFFQGNDRYLQEVREAVSLPVLRKDFVIDEYQIIEARILGADCILLIAAILDDAQLKAFTTLAHDLGMDVLVEVHDQAEFDRALTLPIRAVGVNNRNLRDFSVSREITLTLKKQLPKGYFLISESGFETHEDILEMQTHGVNSFLVGGALMKADDPGQALQELMKGKQ